MLKNFVSVYPAAISSIAGSVFDRYIVGYFSTHVDISKVYAILLKWILEIMSGELFLCLPDVPSSSPLTITLQRSDPLVVIITMSSSFYVVFKSIHSNSSKAYDNSTNSDG